MSADRYRSEPFTQFMTKKALRIFPMAWITITVHALTLTAYRFMTGKELAPIGIWKYIKSMTLIFDAGIIRTEDNGFNNPLWYLGVLIICYAVFWIVNQEELHNRLGSVPVWIFLVLLGLGVTSYETDVPFLNHNTARGIIPFFFGCILFCLYKRIRKWPAVIISLALIIFAAAAYKISYDTFYDNLQYILTFLVYPSVILFMLNSSAANLLFNHKFFGELGKISFEMYIWHVPCFSFIKLLAAQKVVSMPSTFSDMLVITVIVTVVSVIMYYVVEKNLTAWLSARLNKREV